MIQREKRYVEVDVRFSTEDDCDLCRLFLIKGRFTKSTRSRTSAAVPAMWAVLGIGIPV